MILTDYLKDKLFNILILLVVEILSGAMLWIINVRILFIIFFEIILLTGFVVVFIADFIKKSQYYNMLLKTLSDLEEKTLLTEIVKASPFLDAKINYDVLKQSYKYMNDKIAEFEKQNAEYREYVEMWVHEIKTPITSAKLMIENNKNLTTLYIGDEISKIDGFVEQALYYARSTSLEKDFKVEQVPLKEMVNSAVKCHSKFVIQAGGKVEFDSLNFNVYADKKWMSFIIGQIIDNAVKYKKDKLLILFEGNSYADGISLTISDNGIGIIGEDIPRVFDKGFTGRNGRIYSKATGIGLYLCKKLCIKMNVEISISSQVNVGTKVKICFPKSSMIFK